MELPPYIRLTQAFRRAIEGAPPEPGPQPATFVDGLACMRVLAAVRESAAEEGRWDASRGIDTVRVGNHAAKVSNSREQVSTKKVGAT